MDACRHEQEEEGGAVRLSRRLLHPRGEKVKTIILRMFECQRHCCSDGLAMNHLNYGGDTTSRPHDHYITSLPPPGKNHAGSRVIRYGPIALAIAIIFHFNTQF